MNPTLKASIEMLVYALIVFLVLFGLPLAGAAIMRGGVYR